MQAAQQPVGQVFTKDTQKKPIDVPGQLGATETERIWQFGKFDENVANLLSTEDVEQILEACSLGRKYDSIKVELERLVKKIGSAPLDHNDIHKLRELSEVLQTEVTSLDKIKERIVENIKKGPLPEDAKLLQSIADECGYIHRRFTQLIGTLPKEGLEAGHVALSASAATKIEQYIDRLEHMEEFKNKFNDLLQTKKSEVKRR